MLSELIILFRNIFQSGLSSRESQMRQNLKGNTSILHHPLELFSNKIVVENRSNETGDEEYKKEEIEVSCDVRI